jgi:hypothetical protein
LKNLGILSEDIIHSEYNQIPIFNCENNNNHENEEYSNSEPTEKNDYLITTETNQKTNYVGKTYLKIFTDNYYIAESVIKYLKEKNYIQKKKIKYGYRSDIIKQLKEKLLELALKDAIKRIEKFIKLNVYISEVNDFIVNYDEDSGILNYAPQEYKDKFFKKRYIKVINCIVRAVYELKLNQNFKNENNTLI